MSNKSPIDTIQLPQGGGAISGMGEKFSPDLFTGTGNFSVPIAVPSGRNGMQPSLGIGYSTGSGNSPFGLGWNLSIPGVMRQTSKGLPRYDDQKDTFVLSGAEDLVPIPGGSTVAFGELGFVQLYRPRTEGLFARIERHLDVDNDYWKVWTKEGLISFYGTEGAAGNDPATCRDPQDLHKVFGWKLSKTVDPFGNFIAYNYERDAVNEDGPHLWEQSYLKTVQWNDFQNGGTQFLTWVEFIYGERPDPFSEYHQGFEVRTVQRCEEIKIWHDPQLESGYTAPLHVKSYHFTYLDERVASGELNADVLPLNGVSMLSRVQVTGYDGSNDESMPPLDFEYSKFEPLERDFRPIEGESLPAYSMAHPDYELVDLFGRGVPDIVQLNGQPRYWRNKGDGVFDAPKRFKDVPAGVHLADPNVQLIDANGNGTADLMVQKPGISGYFPMHFNGEWSEKSFVKHKTVPSFALNDPEVKFMDLDGDGVTDVIRNGSRMEMFFNDRELGFHELKVVPRGALEDFPEVSFSDHRVRIANLNGSLPSICMVHQGRIDYWPHFGRGKWGKRVTMKNSPRFPDRYNPAHVILGDLDGDGYDDVLYIQHDQITIWFNQSGNAFSEPIVIKGTPPITDKDAVRIVDILGTGAPGILWSAGAQANASWSVAGKMWFLDLTGGQKPYLMNAMRNNLGALTKVEYLPSTHYYNLDYAKPETRWKTPLPFPVLCVDRVEVIDLISESKLTTEYSYHHGYWDGEEREYRGFGRVDQRDTETFDRYNSPGLHGTGTAYEVEALHFSPPTETRTWFHLGPVAKLEADVSVRGVSDWTEADYSHEYWQEDPNVLERPFAMREMLKSLPAKRRREALRTLRGSILRSELYALDNSVLEDRPYAVSENQTGVARLVTLDNNGSFGYELDFDGQITAAGTEVDTGKYWIFFPHGLSSRSSAWERGTEPLTTLGFQFDYDQYGHALQSLSFAVPRTRCLDWMHANSSATEPFFVTRSETKLIHKVDATHYLIGRPEQAWSYEIINDGTDALYDIADQVIGGNWTNESLQGHSINYYDGTTPYQSEGLGDLGNYGIVTNSLQLVLTADILTAAYGTNVPDYLANTGTSITWGTEYPTDFQTSVHDNAGYILDPINSTAGKYYVPTLKAKFDFQLGSGIPRGLVLASKDTFGNESTVTYDDYDLLPVETEDALGMKVKAEYDYRLFQPYLVTNPNGNRAAARFSPLGFVVESGIVGKTGEAVGDWISDTNGLDFDASSWMEYDLFAYMNSGQPAHVRSTQKEHHVNDSNVPSGMMNDTLVQIAYSDGFGRVIQTRAQAEEVIFGDQTFGDSGLASGNTPAIGVQNNSTTAPNVIVNGWKTENNKGAVIEQWEPYYDQGWDFVKPSQAQYGQKITMYYDSIGRAVRTVNPDGTEQRVITGIPSALNVLTNFTPTPWESYTYDANDLAPITPSNSSTVNVASGHYYTPRSVKIDALGRMIESTDRNYKNSAIEEVHMQYFYDIRGNTLRVDDAIKVDVNTSRDSAFLHVYDYANQPLKTTHIDKGTSTVFINAAGIPLEMRDAKGALVLSSFDTLLRPVKMWARDNSSESVTLRQKVVYGDSAGLSNPEIKNLLGMPYKNYDEAGLVIVPEYDFKGQPITKTRKVIKDSIIVAAMPTTYRADWDSLNENTDLEGEYVTDMDYDCIGRPVEITLPEDVNGDRKKVIPSYNRSGGMESVKLDTVEFISRIAYNAKGQKVLMVYSNDLMTRYAYDAVNFRLLRQVTEDFTLSGLTYTPGSGSKKQDCSYEYDLSGNITKMTDATAASGLGGVTGLDRTFAYDALYRLVQATGRESGQYSNYSSPYTEPHVPDNSTSNTRAYTRNYEYDRIGNILKLNHVAIGNTFNRWFNDFQNNAAAFQLSNLATEITYGSTTINYGFDANGNQISEGSSRSFEWDYGDRMRGFAEGTSVRAAYLYDAGGQRVKKIVRNQQGDSVVTLYIDGGFEHIYKYSSGGVASDAYNELHVMDDRARVAVRRVGNAFVGDNSPEKRYNLDDHLGNASFTVDATNSSLITREEYFPFGETSFGSFAKKRYRYNGKERDEESGLYYYGARYYATWTCRFISIDPLAGQMPFSSPYSYAANNPVVLVDVDGLAPGGGGGKDKKGGQSAEGSQAVEGQPQSKSNGEEAQPAAGKGYEWSGQSGNIGPEISIHPTVYTFGNHQTDYDEGHQRDNLPSPIEGLSEVQIYQKAFLYVALPEMKSNLDSKFRTEDREFQKPVEQISNFLSNRVGNIPIGCPAESEVRNRIISALMGNPFPDTPDGSPEDAVKYIKENTTSFWYKHSAAEIGKIALSSGGAGWKGMALAFFSKAESSAISGLIGPGLKMLNRKLVQHAPDWGIGQKGIALTAEELGLMKRVTQHIYKNANTIRQGAWGNPAAGGFQNALFYGNGKHIVVTQTDGTLITILKNAMGNKHFNNASTLWTR